MPNEHPADAWDREQKARAIGYAIHLRISPYERFDERADTLAEAEAIAARLAAQHSKHGRRAIIYALLPEGNAIPLGEPYPRGLKPWRRPAC